VCGGKVSCRFGRFGSSQVQHVFVARGVARASQHAMNPSYPFYDAAEGPAGPRGQDVQHDHARCVRWSGRNVGNEKDEGREHENQHQKVKRRTVAETHVEFRSRGMKKTSVLEPSGGREVDMDGGAPDLSHRLVEIATRIE